MRKLRTRSKYLIVKLLIAAGLTTAVIVIARYSIERDAKQEIGTALERCMERVRALQDRGRQPLEGSAALGATPGEIRQILWLRCCRGESEDTCCLKLVDRDRKTVCQCDRRDGLERWRRSNNYIGK